MRTCPQGVFFQDTSLGNTAYVPQNSVRHEDMPQGVSVRKNTSLESIAPSRTQRAYHNTAYFPQHSVHHEEIPQGIVYPRGTPWEYSVRPTTQRLQWGHAPRSVYSKYTFLENTAYVPQDSVSWRDAPRSVYSKATSLENTAHVPQRSVHKEEMPQRVCIHKIFPLRRQRTVGNTVKWPPQHMFPSGSYFENPPCECTDKRSKKKRERHRK